MQKEAWHKGGCFDLTHTARRLQGPYTVLLLPHSIPGDTIQKMGLEAGSQQEW